MSFSLDAGQLLLVRGGNGRGKTSLLRLLCGLSTPLEGQVLWQGAPINQVREDYHRAMSYVGHVNGVKDDLTPLENMHMAAAVAARPFEEAQALDTLRRMGLARCLDLPARVLSFGQRRRVALSSLLVAGSILWILDEPLTGLDVHGVALVEELLQQHVARGGMVVMTTHQALALDGVDIVPLHVGEPMPAPENG